MSDAAIEQQGHVFLGETHESSERNVWAVIALTVVMMVVEIVGGVWFGSIALVADGFHMSTHAGALLLAALAYMLARRYAHDGRFTFGVGKFGDLAGFASALILGMIALEIGYESATRFFIPTSIAFAQAIPIAALGLLVNVASAWLLSRGGHHHHRGTAHTHAHGDAERSLDFAVGRCILSIHEDGVPPRFRLAGPPLAASRASIETVRPDGMRQRFALADRGDFLESIELIPEPHAFEAIVRIDDATQTCRFEEHAHDAKLNRDHNMRAAIVHVIADAAVSVFVIVGLTLAKLFGWLWMDPLAGLVGAVVIASWAVTLVRDTGRVLLDVNADPGLCKRLKGAIEHEGDSLADLHVWRLGPGHLGAIVSIETSSGRGVEHYRDIVRAIGNFSHLTVEVLRRASVEAPMRGAA